MIQLDVGLSLIRRAVTYLTGTRRHGTSVAWLFPNMAGMKTSSRVDHLT